VAVDVDATSRAYLHGLAGVRANVGLEKDRDHDGQADQEQGCAQQFSRWTSHD
jgi:hypothetical protein